MEKRVAVECKAGTIDITYLIKSSVKSFDTLDDAIVYGLLIYLNDELFLELDDISSELEKVETIVGILSEHQVYPEHIFYVIEDLICM